ncbi:MAG: phage tail protein [Rhizobiales bacterium]|nr:phage tail protein [Hyphomicrobiales bacterium]
MSAIRALNPVLTRAGMRAIFSKSDDGLAARITHVAFGDRRYEPIGAETALRRERARLPVLGGKYLSDYVIELVALLDADTAFEVAEMGVFLEDGTLLAVWSDADTPLAYFQPGVPIAVSYVLGVSALPPGSVTVSGDLDLTLFFGPEFARLSRAAIAAQDRLTTLADRLGAVEAALAELAAQRGRIERLETLAAEAVAREERLAGAVAAAASLGLLNAKRAG